MPGRKYSAGNSYRYGFNGKEKSDDVSGEGNVYDYGFRIYNPRLVRFLSVDPLSYSYPYYTPYQFAGNMPIAAIDLDGLEQYVVIYFKDQKGGDPYKVKISAVKSGNILMDQNVQKFIKATGQTDGDKVAKNNVLVFEVYNEGTKNEQMAIVNDKRKNLTPEEADIFKHNKEEVGKGDTRFGYPFADNIKYQSQDFEGARFYDAIKLYNQVPPLLKADFQNASLKLKDEKEVTKLLLATAKYLKANSKKSLLITGYSGLTPGVSPNSTSTRIDGKNVPDAEAQNDRAKVIKGILLKLGVKESQLQTTNGGNINIPTGGSVPVGLKIKNK